MTTKKLTTIVIDALEDIKARDIKLINVSKLTSVFDYIAVASADSTRQTKALAKNVMDRVKEHGGWIYGIEGEQSGEWVLVDCGDIVVHIMQPAMRELYELEELWGEGSLEFPKPKPVVRATPVKSVAKPGAKAKTVKSGVVVKKKTAAAATGATKKLSAAGAKKVEVKKVTIKKPVAKKPAVKKPVTAKPPRPIAKKPAIKKPAAKKPVLKKPVAKKPAVKKPVAKKLVAKKPAAKKVTTKKSAAKKTVSQRRKVATD